ncbi:MAG TPA: prepilin peptidase [Terriglobia bacterium]|nr:prepilin peptidase [Terriglobia bacterium]
MHIPTLMPYAVVALFGLALGSFLNVCIFRLPRHESVVTPRSHCPHCSELIRWYDTVPVLSYLLLRGRCRKCRARISPIYPTVELLSAAVLLLAFFQYGLSPAFIKFAVFGLLLLILIFTDLRERRLPHAVTLLGIGLGLALSFIVPVDPRPLDWIFHRLGSFPGTAFLSFTGAVAAAALGGGLLYAVAEVFYRVTGKEGLGFGDVMLMLMVGAFLGIPLALLTILIGSLLGTIVALPFEVFSTRFRHYPWPYGSFLGAAALYASLGGNTLLDAYLRWALLK